ncbi:hypothetical protein [Armatimonas rosea]|uniref:Uncharacterized protein n=1 Tax=Armatimonas rosea TaxID=685828 RepID=A0A7W9W672_ARMRO|nr:hypothetical protein [Armatimonas rosea]MBB6049695.1 hypothetical protein [Armatimonas rosea]
MPILEKLTYWPSESAWLARLEASDLGIAPDPTLCFPLEIELPGTPEDFDSTHLPFVELALPQLHALLETATRYIAAFVREPQEDYCLEGLYFGDSPGKMELLLSYNDDRYGQWRVRFQYVKQRKNFLPFYFSREQI